VLPKGVSPSKPEPFRAVADALGPDIVARLLESVQR
jgi:hypothetical protein